MEGNDAKHNHIPPLQRRTFKLEERPFTPWERGTRVTRLAHRRLTERGKVAAASQFILDTQPAVDAEIAGPFGVYFAFEIEAAASVGDIAWDDEEGECGPEEEGVDGEEGAVVEEDTGPAD